MLNTNRAKSGILLGGRNVWSEMTTQLQFLAAPFLCAKIIDTMRAYRLFHLHHPHNNGGHYKLLVVPLDDRIRLLEPDYPLIKVLFIPKSMNFKKFTTTKCYSSGANAIKYSKSNHSVGGFAIHLT